MPRVLAIARNGLTPFFTPLVASFVGQRLFSALYFAQPNTSQTSSFPRFCALVVFSLLPRLADFGEPPFFHQIHLLGRNRDE